jgi:hypothetical protein
MGGVVSLTKYESLEKMYLENTTWGASPMDSEEQARFEEYMSGIREQGKRLEATGLVLFVCGLMDSSSFGHSKGVFFGPGCTYKSAESVPQGDLDTELASTRKQPVGWAEL